MLLNEKGWHLKKAFYLGKNEISSHMKGHCAKPTLSECHRKDILGILNVSTQKVQERFWRPNKVLAQGNKSINSLETYLGNRG